MSETRSFHWRDRTVAWRSFGAGPPVVLLHGTPWSSQLWMPIARTLSQSFTVYLWDMPGYGASSKHPQHGVDLGTQGELFADLLIEWQLDRPHVIAHDFGGAVALRALLLQGAAYASLCLVDVVALSPWGSPFFQLVREHADVFTRLPPAIHRGAVEAYVQGAGFRALDQRSLDMLVAPWMTAEGQSAFYRQIAQADERFTAQVEPLYASIDVPVHIAWGTDDTWIPVDVAHRLASMIPDASLTLIPDAGHLIQLDAPAELTADLNGWLSAQSN